MKFKKYINNKLIFIKKHWSKHKEFYGLISPFIGFIIGKLLEILGVKNSLYLGIFITILIFIGYGFLVTVKKYYKYVSIIISVFLILIGSYVYFIYKPDPKIFQLTKGYTLKFEDKLIDGNFKQDIDNKWIYIKDGFEKGLGGKELTNSVTIRSKAYPEGKNAIYQDLSKYKGDFILLAKFLLKDKSSVGLDFILKHEPGTRGSSYQGCGVTTYSGKNGRGYIISNSLNYINQYNGKINDYKPSQVGYIKEGIYYMLAKISDNKISCYTQNIQDSSYSSVVEGAGFYLNQLGGPKLIKYTNSEELKPYLLDFKIYSK